MLRNIPIKLLVVALFCVSVPICSLAQTNAGQQKGKRKTKVETSYDEKKNETTARIGPFELYKPPQNSNSGELDYERIDLSVAFSYPGKRIVKPKFVTLMVFSSSEGGAQFDKRRALSFSTNSGQYDLGEMQLVGRGEGRVAKKVTGPANLLLVREALMKSVPFDDFARIAQSEKAEIKVGNRKIKLGKEHLEAFRNFVLLMKQEGLEF